MQRQPAKKSPRARRVKSIPTRDNRGALLFLLALYSLVMIWLMLLYRTQGSVYLLNIIPFHTIKHFGYLFLKGNYAQKAAAAVNLGGNVIMFMPLGLFLPALWKKQNNFFIYILTVTLIVVALETAQYFTKLGTADIDDLLLNDVGAVIGFFIYKLIRK